MGILQKLFGSPKAQAVHFPRVPDSRRINVEGESKFQPEISRITGRRGDEGIEFACVAVLTPTSNGGVAVEIESQRIGFLGRADQKDYRPLVEVALNRGRAIAGDAVIRAVDPKEAATPNAGVTLWLPSPGEIDVR